MLQETHLFLGKNQKMFSKEFPVWFYGDSHVSRAKGVTIGFASGVRFELYERKTDPEGRYLFLSGKLNATECSLAHIYGPNKNPNSFMIGMLAEFMEFKKGVAIMADNFNLCLEPGKDNMSHARGMGMAWNTKVKQKLHQYQLVDAWRSQHTNSRDYTFDSPIQGTYSRLDFFLIEHRWLEAVTSSNIGIITFSDHAPVSLTLNIGQLQKKSSFWRLN